MGQWFPVVDDAVGGVADTFENSADWVFGGIGDTISGTGDVIGDTGGGLLQGPSDFLLKIVVLVLIAIVAIKVL